jgi:hypothetical protein
LADQKVLVHFASNWVQQTDILSFGWDVRELLKELARIRNNNVAAGVHLCQDRIFVTDMRILTATLHVRNDLPFTGPGFGTQKRAALRIALRCFGTN